MLLGSALLGGVAAGDLAAELAADGAAGAGDEDAAAAQHAVDGGVVNADRLASQQVLDLDLAELARQSELLPVRIREFESEKERIRSSQQEKEDELAEALRERP